MLTLQNYVLYNNRRGGANMEKAQFNKDNVLTIIKGMKLRARKGMGDFKLSQSDHDWFWYAHNIFEYLESIFSNDEKFESSLKTAKVNIRKLGKRYG